MSKNKESVLGLTDNIKENTIIFSNGGDDMIEVLRFTKDKMFLKGVEITEGKDVIKGMREFLTNTGYFKKESNE